MDTADVTGGEPIVCSQSISSVSAVYLVPFTTSMKERERCYSVILSQIPHKIFLRFLLMVFFIPILLNGVVTTCFHHVVIKIRHLFLATLWLQTTANAAGTNGLASSLRTLLRFRDRTPSAMTASPSSSSKIEILCFRLIVHHSRFTPKGIAEVSPIFLRDTHVLPKLLSCEEYCRRDRW
jgi:hypothetical protein